MAAAPFYDNSRVGYNSCSLICRTEPFPEGTYCVTCEVRHVEALMLKEKGLI